MRIGVLGTLVVDGSAPNLREATMLAALALRPGRAVDAATLADAYWGEAPPATWPKQVQSAISRLRRSLGGAVIATVNGGYSLDVPAAALDSTAFAEAVDEAHRLAGSDDPARACAELDRALRMWRGRAFTELSDWGPAQVEINRLEDLRLMAEEDLATAMVEAGEHRAAVALAERMVAESPYREERWAILALATYRSGRQADALSALRAARRRLRDDLGIDPGERLLEMEQAILTQSPALLSEPHDMDEGPCPYRGLRPFGLDDTRWFHGREDVVANTLATLDRAGVVTVVGASGSGKSSVALAGVAATMYGRGWNVEVVTPSDFGARSDSTADLLAQPSPLVVVLDQFEELFTGAGSDVRSAEIGGLIDRLVTRGDEAIVTVRSEFLDRVAALPEVGPLLAANVQAVGPMTAEELRSAIEQPARVARLPLEAGLSAIVLRDADGSTTPLPLLSHALAEAWRRRRNGVLTVADYEESGGIAGAVSSSAEALYASLSHDERRCCRALLHRLMTQDRDGIVLRRRLDAAAVAESPAERSVLARLIEARLVTVQDGRVLLSHEAILTAWPRLRRWIADEQDAMRVLSRLSTVAEEWDAGGRLDADLYRGPRLAAAVQSARDARSLLTSVDRAFLDASHSLAQAEAATAESRRRSDARSRRRLLVALLTTTALFVVSIAATSIAVAGAIDATRSADLARAAQTDATIEALLETSIGLRASERDVGALIAAEMWRRWPDDPRSRAALMSVFTASGGLVETTYLDGGRVEGALLGGGPLAVVVDGDDVHIRDLVTGEVIDQGSLGIPPGSEVLDLVASGDGSMAAVLVRQPDAASGGRYVLSAFDLGAQVRTTDFDVGVAPDDIAISTDGRLLAVSSRSGATVTVFDVRSGSTRRSHPLAPGSAKPEFTSAATVTFLPSGLLAVGTTGRELVLLDPTSLAVASRIAVPALSTNVDTAVVGEQLVASGDNGIIDIDLRTRTILWQRASDPPKPTACVRLAASLDSGRFYCADAGGRIAERSLGDGLPTARWFDPQLGATGAIAVIDGGRQLVAFGASTATISRWSTNGGGAVTRLIAEGDAAFDGYGGDGGSLLVAERTPSARIDFDMTAFSIWDPDTDEPVLRLPGANVGVAWAGPDLLMGYLEAAGGEPAVASASDGTVRADIPAPLDAERGWLSPTGDRYYLGLTSGIIETLDAETGLSIGPTFGAGGFPRWVSASPDGSRVVITRLLAGALTTGVFDGESGELVVDGLTGAGVTAVGTDGALYAATDGRVSIHDIETLAAIGTIPGARGEINSLQIDRAGRTMLITAVDDTALLVDVATGLRLGDAIPAYAPLITQGFLRPDGQQAVVNIEQGIQRWDLNPGHQYAAACRIAGRELTAEEWSTYFGDLKRADATCAGALP